MSAMRDMSRAIREQLQVYGPTLQEVPTEVLREQAQIVTAFSLDLRAELERREEL